MAGNDRADDAAAATTAAQELHERISRAQGELDAARARLQQLQQQRAATEEQLETIELEIEQLRRDLHRRLGDWCTIEDLDLRCEKLSGCVGKLESVHKSFTFRAVAALLRLVNRARALLSFGWLRPRG